MAIETTVTSDGQSLIEGKYTEEWLLLTAKSNVAKKSNSSTIFNEKAENAVPRFDFSGK
jgi:hypothetical protein